MKEKPVRIAVIGVIFFALFSVFTWRLYTLQIVEGEEFSKKSKSRVVTQTTVKAARGEILDRNCRPIVTNDKVFTAEFNLSLIKDLNGTIARVISVFDSCGQAYATGFPLSVSEPFVLLDGAFASEREHEQFKTFLSEKKIDPSLSPEEIIEKLAGKYSVTGYNKTMTAKVVAVRYSMEKNTVNRFYTFAENLSLSAATALKEHTGELAGVTVEEVPVRTYTHDYFASHIIGTVGKIYAEEYEALAEKGYSRNDTIGRDGIEKVCEDVLKGVDGARTAIQDVTGNSAETVSSSNKEPQKGNDVILTLDTNMQMICEKALPEVIDALHELNGEESATSGAAVFMDIETAEILASASYPTYNLETFNQDYDTLKNLPSSPYLNRVISGVFAPGSTYKMVTAIAGLETGVLNSKTSYSCPGRYTYYSDYQPTCFASRAHGRVTVIEALQKSCNGYFFDAARRMGIDTLDDYCYLLGFGQKSGIELLGEQAGMVASKEGRESRGQFWTDGETLLAGIGQSDHAVTPLQLCNYVATLSRCGSRLEPHIIKSVRNNETGQILSETLPKELSNANFSEENVALVLKGMQKVTQYGGSLGGVFDDFTLSTVAVKTGTAEVTNGLPNSLLVGVAPAEDPKIAFAVVIENGGAGSSATLSVLVKEVLTYYFTGSESSEQIHTPGTLLP